MSPNHLDGPLLSRAIVPPVLARFDRLVKEDLGSVLSGWGEPVFRSYAAKVCMYFL